MNTNKPLLELVEKLMTKGYVQIRIRAICFEFSGINELRVFTIKEVLDQHDFESFVCNEVDLTLKKLNLPKIEVVDDTEPKPKPKPKPEPANEFLRLASEPHITTKAEVIGQTEHAVLINELIKTKYLTRSEFMINEYEQEFNERFSDPDTKFAFGYIGIHPYTAKKQKIENRTKLHISIYWGIRHFVTLNPDADKIPAGKFALE